MCREKRRTKDSFIFLFPSIYTSEEAPQETYTRAHTTSEHYYVQRKETHKRDLQVSFVHFVVAFVGNTFLEVSFVRNIPTHEHVPHQNYLKGTETYKRDLRTKPTKERMICSAPPHTTSEQKYICAKSSKTSTRNHSKRRATRYVRTQVYARKKNQQTTRPTHKITADRRGTVCGHVYMDRVHTTLINIKGLYNSYQY